MIRPKFVAWAWLTLVVLFFIWMMPDDSRTLLLQIFGALFAFVATMVALFIIIPHD